MTQIGNAKVVKGKELIATIPDLNLSGIKD